MEYISPALQTLFAELVQQVYSAPIKAGTVYTQTDKGTKYLYAKYSVGRTRRDFFIGPAEDQAAQELADQIRSEQKSSRQRRGLVRALRDNGVPVPNRTCGAVLDVMSDAGLFEDAVLVGTAAYFCYSPILGVFLPAGSLTTQDADLATTSLALAVDGEKVSMLNLLRRADESFAPVPSLRKAVPPSSFRTQEGFLVDLLTPQRRRSDRSPMPLENLKAGATPLQYLDWLIGAPVRTVALHGSGIPIRVPQPSKYAVHKLIIGQKRARHERTKRRKDLLQALALVEALSKTDPHSLQDALEEAFDNGTRGWKQPVLRSLKELGIDPRSIS